MCEAHTAAVLAYALRRTSRDDAADVVAETFLVAWRRLDEVEERSALPWLYAVARRVLLSQQRSTRRQQAIAERLAAAEPSGLLETVGSSVGSRCLLDALAGLSETEREVLLLSAWEELSSTEAAVVVALQLVLVTVQGQLNPTVTTMEEPVALKLARHGLSRQQRRAWAGDDIDW